MGNGGRGKDRWFLKVLLVNGQNILGLFGFRQTFPRVGRRGKGETHATKTLQDQTSPSQYQSSHLLGHMEGEGERGKEKVDIYHPINIQDDTHRAKE